jgi:hypothetical protein
MRKFVLITLALVILYLVWKNAETLKTVLTTVTGLFRQSFTAVTEVGEFK